MLIGLAGKKRSGKDTVARMLQAHGFVPSSFAAPLRSFVAGLLGATLEELDREKETPLAFLDGATPRQMMQTLGTEWGRAMVHPELWTRSWAQRYRSYIDAGADLVVTDVRFENEAEIIWSAGGYVVELHRPGLSSDDSHISEAGLPGRLIHASLYNDCDMETLQQRVADMLTFLQQQEPAHGRSESHR